MVLTMDESSGALEDCPEMLLLPLAIVQTTVATTVPFNL